MSHIANKLHEGVSQFKTETKGFAEYHQFCFTKEPQQRVIHAVVVDRRLYEDLLAILANPIFRTQQTNKMKINETRSKRSASSFKLCFFYLRTKYQLIFQNFYVVFSNTVKWVGQTIQLAGWNWEMTWKTK